MPKEFSDRLYERQVETLKESANRKENIQNKIFEYFTQGLDIKDITDRLIAEIFDIKDWEKLNYKQQKSSLSSRFKSLFSMGKVETLQFLFEKWKEKSK